MKAQQENLKTYLPKVLKRYETYKKSHGGDNLIQRFLQGLLQEIDDDRSIVQYCENDEESVKVNYSRFYQISKTLFKEMVNEVTIEEVGLFFYLCLNIELQSNMLINTSDSKKPLASNEIVKLLELSNEKTKELLVQLTQMKLIIQVKNKPTNALFINPEFAKMKSTVQGFNRDYDKKLQYLKFKTPIMINHSAIRFQLFKKKDRNERISHGKRVLGTLIRITLQMNVDNEIKIGKHTKSTLIGLICAKTGLDQLSIRYIELLIDNNFLLVKDELIIVNPYFAQYTKSRKFKNITQLEIDSLRNLIY